jgi:SAM-dependent methyltransferase
VPAARTADDVRLHLRLSLRLWESRPDLRRAHPDPASPEYWFWTQWSGAAEAAGRETGSFDAPPPELMSRVAGTTAAVDFHRGGLLDWRRVREALERGGCLLDGGGTKDLLEFGCGCGRILRFFARYVDTCRLTGVDVDAGAIAWCREHLRFAEFETIPQEPELPFPDASFDAIYAFSVFSHLPEARHLGWLRELRRVARPGAVAVLTVHGRRVLDLAASGERPEVMPHVSDRRAAAERAEREGFLFVPYRSLDAMDALGRDHFADWDLDAYGSAFVLEPYVRRQWGEIFDIVRIDEAPDGWQDYVTLRAR